MWLFIVLILVQMASIALCAISIKKLYAYINQYRFSESVYTLLFRVIRLRYIVYLYAILVGLAFVLALTIGFASLPHVSPLTP